MMDLLKQTLSILVFPIFIGLLMYNSYAKIKATQKELENIARSKQSKLHLNYVLNAHRFIIGWMVFMLFVFLYILSTAH